MSNPYVIGSHVDCDDIGACICQAAGPGLECADNKLRVKISDAAGNTVTIGPDGGVYGAGGSGGGGVVATADTACIDMGGQGTAGSPLTAAPIINPAAGNLLACTPAGMRAALTVGACGLTGDGTDAAPLAAKVQTWPFACDVTAKAGGVYCDANGVLRSDPRPAFDYQQNQVVNDYPDKTVPAAEDTWVETRTLDVVNPDPCRPANLLVVQELDVDLVLPANAGGAYGFGTDEMVYHRNRGSTTESDFHVQVTKVGRFAGPIPPGGTTQVVLNVSMGRGVGGATYNRIQTLIRAFLFIF
ncbi:hypothetical protein [Microtetraspora malaysiensis]|uniref:Uncharacterized protein n=1 Tax=Microtetraspora malaysiensis TaxID=161358 RepID=A0ABW6SKJ3_9ACTN